ncbi:MULTISPECIES: hypothetical protein [Enterobacterales]|uniref:hypothetical protein n=1 Tax=Enterobacterales TaxID=91347 RepID=UPI000B14DD72|nr:MULTISPECIES: hypothetical protein [Pectobacterium]MCA6965488.1 hypothetical protein [Pectobacterium carotovorum]MCH4987912.1 hypothetical protein [Pectobacterium carotovorum]
MPNIRDLANSSILFSHHDFYKTPRSFNKILGRSDRKHLLSCLSFLSYSHREEPRFRDWSIKVLCKTKKQRNYAMERAVFSRLQCWRLWTVLFSEWSYGKNSQEHRPEFEVLHEAFAKLNDRRDDVRDDTEQAFIKAIVSQARDNRLSKLRRTQHIFLADGPLSIFVNAFEKKIGVPLKTYINTIYFIIEHWHRLPEKLHSSPNLAEWSISVEWLSDYLQIPAEQISAILKDISFSIFEGREFSQVSLSKPNEFTLYRERPLLEIENNRFIPVEGKLLEELLFENLFHRIHQANNKSLKFLSTFGFEFEKYAQRYALKFVQDLVQYELIEEFDFNADGEKKLKSSDLMIAIPEKNCVIIFEIKSARPLYTSFITENNPQSVNESLDKLQDRPWSQAISAISKIIRNKVHPTLVEKTEYFIVSVTMNNYPMILQENVATNSAGKDISAYLYSFDIETFEVLMRAARLSPDYSIRDHLLWCYQNREKMSAKTTIVRFIKALLAGGVTEDNVYKDVLQDAWMEYYSFFQ